MAFRSTKSQMSRGSSQKRSEQKEEISSLIQKPEEYLSISSRSTSAVSHVLNITAHLANLLPTGTLLAFQLLIPTFTGNGSCDSTTRSLTLLLLLLLAASAFIACFTDSFRLPDGRVFYGLATPHGMWVFEPPPEASALPDLSKYKARIIDCVHAVLSALVFAAVALRDKNVLQCFYPSPEKSTKEVLDILPLGIGVICSMLFAVFPTTRHGIGYPITNAGQLP